MILILEVRPIIILTDFITRFVCFFDGNQVHYPMQCRFSDRCTIKNKVTPGKRFPGGWIN